MVADGTTESGHEADRLPSVIDAEGAAAFRAEGVPGTSVEKEGPRHRGVVIQQTGRTDDRSGVVDGGRSTVPVSWGCAQVAHLAILPEEGVEGDIANGRKREA